MASIPNDGTSSNKSTSFQRASADSHQDKRRNDTRPRSGAVNRTPWRSKRPVGEESMFDGDEDHTDLSPGLAGNTGGKRQTIPRDHQPRNQKNPTNSKTYRWHRSAGNTKRNSDDHAEEKRKIARGGIGKPGGATQRWKVSGDTKTRTYDHMNRRGQSGRNTATRGPPERRTSTLDHDSSKAERPEGGEGAGGGGPRVTHTDAKRREPAARARLEESRGHGEGTNETDVSKTWCSVSANNSELPRRSGNLRASKQQLQQTQVRHKPKTPPFTEQELQSFVEEKPSDILSRLVVRREECLSLLNQDTFSETTLLLTLRLLSSMCDLDPATASTTELNVVLSMIESSLFLSKHLTRYLVSLPLKQVEDIDGSDADDAQSPSSSDIGMTLKLLRLFLQHKPSCYSEVGGALILLERVVTKGCLVSELQQLKVSYNSVEQAQKTIKHRAMEKPPPDNFRDIPIFPGSKEIRQVTKPFLRKNIIQGRYDGVEHYLDVQFRLLREDFVAPLREGVTEYLSDKTGRPQDIRIYHKVLIEQRKMGDNGFVYTLKFDTKPFKRVRWESSKRLLYGSFVCLTRDDFQHILCATIENRDVKNLEEGLVDVRFLTETAISRGPFTMAESAAYFEACRHVLQGLQQIHEYNFPFKKYIVDVASNVDPPAYLQDDLSVTYDLRALIVNDCKKHISRHVEDVLSLESDIEDDVSSLESESCNVDDGSSSELESRLEDVSILEPESWPSTDVLRLDESQRDALQTALTKEFAIIQGPPGTGKTYIGLKIIQILLRNQHWLHNRERTSPILVVCYTNHALDQFLEGIIAFGQKNIVRVGSRSDSELLKSKNLSCLRRNRSGGRQRRRVDAEQLRRNLHETDVAIRQILFKLQLPSKVLLNAEAIQEYMNIGEYRALSLQRRDEEPQGDPSAKLLQWLNVVDVQIEDDRGHPFTQDQGSAGRENYDRIHVEDEGARIQHERQIDDYGWRPSREERQQNLEEQTFHENAAYNLNSNKRCGKYHRFSPVVELQKPDVMTDDEANQVERVWYLKIWDRWRLYRLWVRRYMEDHEVKLQRQRQKYDELYNKLQAINVQDDLEILRGANVIGMTTTGAAKCRSVLQLLGPRIVVVEEAAEVLEAHIITTLTKHCQHLILIGDHQQLKPNPTVYRLAKMFNLDTSLFERMINNGVPCKSLTHQHRMRPEISSLMRTHFYRKLQDDESVLNMDNVKGVVHNMFFIDHQHLEDDDDDDRTRSNQYEAEILVELCRYLLRQGYKRSQITVLTTYTGQLFCFRRLMDKATFGGVRVCVVDNFQGEENDIILLSLVRSNEEGAIGFLRISNRVCVALSRARIGFYCIGNASILKKARIWEGILGTLESKSRIGSSLPLVCQNHPDKIVQVTTAEDFKEMAPCGGCKEPCEYRLPCGHVCVLSCHPYDPDHKNYKCEKPCLKTCDRNEHLCPLRCYKKCQPCEVKVQKEMPRCGHVIQVYCHEFQEVTCTEPCPKLFDICDHKCPLRCGQSCPVTCPAKCERSLACGHSCTLPCGKPCTEHCEVQVVRTLPKCGHTASMDCGTSPDEHKCKTKVTNELPGCGHRVRMLCYENPNTIVCKERCTKILSCEHRCPNVCGEPCERSGTLRFLSFRYRQKVKVCEELTEKSYPSCNHSVKLPCHRDVSSVPCTKPCEKLLACGHKCPRKCHELCLDEKEDDEVVYKFSVSSEYYNEYYFSIRCKERCNEVLSCGHPCPNKCGEPCPQAKPDFRRRYLGKIRTKCEMPVQKQLPNCRHAVRVPCFKDISSFVCLKSCEKVLVCSHRCPNKCSEPCPGDASFGQSDRSVRPKQRSRTGPLDRCEQIVAKTLACGHGTRSLPCWRAANFNCKEPCTVELACGHKCRGDCESCKQGSQHKPCSKKCTRQLVCGHNCSEECKALCSPDCRKCHEEARHDTSQDIHPRPPCRHRTKHRQLKTNACVRPCGKNLPCKHPCIGVCGEPCPPFCVACSKKKVQANLPKKRIGPRDTFIYLPDCGHLCETRTLDKMAAAALSSIESSFFNIRSLLCPKCKEPIRRCPRYDSILHIINESVNAAKRKCKDERRRRSEAISRNDEGATTSMSFDVGRWMRCHQGHVFCHEENSEALAAAHQEEPRCPDCCQASKASQSA